MVGIVSYGAYIPLSALSRELVAKAWDFPSVPGSKSVAGADEDSVTMAVEASMDCLAGLEPGEVDGVFFATTTPPYAEKMNAPTIAWALDVRREAMTVDFTGSLRAGTTALIAAYNTIRSGRARRILVAAADCRIPEPESMYEFQFGDGAAAVLVGEGGEAAKIVDYYTLSDEFIGPWRKSGDVWVREFEARHDVMYGYGRNALEVVAGLMAKTGLKPEDVSKLVLYAPEPRSHVTVAQMLGFKLEQLQDTLFFSLGVTGAPHPLIMLASALETAKPGDRLIVVGVGDGGDAILLEVGENIGEVRKAPRRGVKGYLETMKPLKNYDDYIRFRNLLGKQRFTRKTSTVTYWRDRKEILPLKGVRCKSCGAVQYPIVRVCYECGSKDNFDEVRLAKRGTIFTFTLDHLVGGDYYATPVPRVVVELEGGGRVFVDMTDCNPEEVKVGMPVELTFRIIHESEGFYHYYWKARPVREKREEA
ncbi:MAG: OB-fold domain-containing protein [Candidatus Jordarchaeales archaeon]